MAPLTEHMTALLPYCQFIPKRLHDLTFPAGVPQFHCIGLDEVHEMKINKGYTGTIVMLQQVLATPSSFMSPW